MTRLQHIRSAATIALMACATIAMAHGGADHAPVQVSDGWVRAAVPGQSGTGAFMKLTAPNGATLVGVSTPAAGVAEVHEMKMEGDVMKMRAVPGALELPAHQTVELKPGGYHIMLMELKQPLAAGATVPLTLHLKDDKGAPVDMGLQVPVMSVAPTGGQAMHKH